MGAAQPNLNTDIIKNYLVPYCSFEEQQLVVQELESKLTVCDKIEETITQSLQQAETLRQSILKKAFEGKLITMEEAAAPKGRDVVTMGAAHREENIPPAKALKGRNE
jgi:type I restriction enzyme S subunit